LKKKDPANAFTREERGPAMETNEDIPKENKKISKEIEAVFEKFYAGKAAYSKGQFYKGEFYLRTDYLLVVVDRNKNILVSFADHTRPSYAALFSFLLEDVKGTNLLVCEDYRTDEEGSMVFDEMDGSSTAAIIWDEKERYYSMLRSKVEKVVIQRLKKEKK
jgi:hypothetical protein